MKSAKEFWIRKGTCDFSYEFWNEDGTVTKSLDRGDKFYDAIVTEPIEGGLHVVEYSALAASLAENKKLREDLLLTKVGSAHNLAEKKAHIAESETFVKEATDKIQSLTAERDELKMENYRLDLAQVEWPSRYETMKQKLKDEIKIHKAQIADRDERIFQLEAIAHSDDVIKRMFELFENRREVDEENKKLRAEIAFAIKYLESTGIDNEKHRGEPEFEMLNSFRAALKDGLLE